MDRVIAIGFFDGVHAGHAAVINAAKAAAGKYGLRPAVLTFDRRPGNAVRNEDARLISDFNAKCCLIESLFGIRDVISLPFDSLLRGLPPEKFVTEYLITRFGAAGAAVGENFRFGRGAAGTPELLSAFLPTVRVSTVQRDGRPVSSGAVREMLASGDIAAANAACGHPYTICGTVEHGFGRGRRMDMPTANLNLSEDLLRLRRGVMPPRTVEGVRRLSVTISAFARPLRGKITPWKHISRAIPGSFTASR